ncbi:MAG: hypothetical protein K8R54_18705 [Bacteroidales bacterium]|nr:hypothetical protein [Bacteroidales bacterium]
MKRLIPAIFLILIFFSSCFFKDEYKEYTPEPEYYEYIIQDVALLRFFQEGANDSLHTKFIADNVFERSNDIILHVNIFDSLVFKTDNMIVSKYFDIKLDDTADTILLTPIIKSKLNLEQIESIVFDLSNENTAVDFGGLYDAYYTFMKDSMVISQDFAYAHIDYEGNFIIRFKHTADSLYAEGRIRNDSTLEYAFLKNIENNKLISDIICFGYNKLLTNDSLKFELITPFSEDTINRIDIKLIKK